MRKVVFLVFSAILVSTIAKAEVIYDTPERLSESPIGAMYTKVVILKDDDWIAKNMDEWSNQKKWLKTVVEHNAKATVGVVSRGMSPSPWGVYAAQVDEFKTILQEHPNNIEVYCHGLTHEGVKNDNENWREFYNRPYTSQNNSLYVSKQVVSKYLDYNLKVFDPPFNTYDDNAVKAAIENGFLVFFGERVDEIVDSILFLPIGWSAWWYDSFTDLHVAVEKFGGLRDVSPLVIQTHSWGHTPSHNKVFGDFLDYLFYNETIVFMTGYEYYKWFHDQSNVTLIYEDGRYILDMSQTMFEHEISFNKSGLKNIVVTDISTNEGISYKEINNRLAFKTFPSHVYRIEEKHEIRLIEYLIILTVMVVFVFLVRYFKLFK